ncbi:MAG: PhnD/SsuA/transferrin family substrate-binding protein [Candidatus Firestonebacteria bacterium]|nr:PhnD/SsuA/transferrin family substrate-binding protein [Candidatus Firestonebacteria bacterium]
MRKMFLFLLLFAFINMFSPSNAFSEKIILYFPPDWQEHANNAKQITDNLSKNSGLNIQPLIAKSYHQIFDAFSEKNPVLVYIGSFVQAILYERKLSFPIAQGINGREFYTSVMLVQKQESNDAVAIVKNAGVNIAYTKSASSGESGAKAASYGKANIGVISNTAAANAVKVGKAKAAFVKNWWWEDNKNQYPTLKKLDYPGVSDKKNPDNILSANMHVSFEDIGKISSALNKCRDYFKVDEFQKFDARFLTDTLTLMEKAKIDLVNYKW